MRPNETDPTSQRRRGPQDNAGARHRGRIGRRRQAHHQSRPTPSGARRRANGRRSRRISAECGQPEIIDSRRLHLSCYDAGPEGRPRWDLKPPRTPGQGRRHCSGATQLQRGSAELPWGVGNTWAGCGRVHGGRRRPGQGWSEAVDKPDGVTTVSCSAAAEGAAAAAGEPTRARLSILAGADSLRV
jgi:hypothetical protein